jgi:hypothetical protein
LQDSPEEIPGLYDSDYVRFGFGLERKRYDSVVAKNLPSKLLIGRHENICVELNDFIVA